MKAALKWIGDALSQKNLVAEKSYYKVADKEIRATDGLLIASHPWPSDVEFVVPGEELEKVFARMKDEPAIKAITGQGKLEGKTTGINIRSGMFHGSISTLSLDKWSYPDVEGARWQDIPERLMPVLKALRPFLSDNAMQKWATCVALENDWAYATNNVAIAGSPCEGIGPIMALLPMWAVDFVLTRTEGLKQWAWTENYVAFLWDNGAWMRAQLVIGQFPEKAAALDRESVKEKTTQKISPEFRQAFSNVAELAEDTVMLYKDRAVAKFKQAEVMADIKCKVPKDQECSIWGAEFLIPALAAADSWSPDVWPKPAPFRGKIVSGYVVGRRA